MMAWLFFVLALQAQAPHELDVSSLAVSAPQLVCQLDVNILKGDVRRLSWSFFDRQKRKKAVPGTRDSLPPAWSPDGNRVAFLQRDGRRAYCVMVTSISRPSS